MILVVLLALAVIVNEVRVARKGRRKRGRTQVSAATGASGAALGRSLDLDAAARSERPSILLQMLVATLVKAGRLQAERSLTHRELTARAKFDDSSQRESFRRVAQLAERIVYGGDEAPAGTTDSMPAATASSRSMIPADPAKSSDIALNPSTRPGTPSWQRRQFARLGMSWLVPFAFIAPVDGGTSVVASCAVFHWYAEYAHAIVIVSSADTLVM